MVERIAYRGKNYQEVQSMTLEEYTKLIKSRQRRSIKRNSLLIRKLNKKIEKVKASNSGKIIKTHVREAVILPGWIGLKFGVHNGKEFQTIEITPLMLGHRLGEFAFTTKAVQHSAPGIRATKGSKFLAVK
ncbi:MAG: 30S ribosomal protein S19 [Candidatus Marsarchaeota archaeon]|jgi:small subunit ribosomal protein S19|nr:30S ribosomal protein S19 [Candidatus Marsarchaeota archaeon]